MLMCKKITDLKMCENKVLRGIIYSFNRKKNSNFHKLTIIIKSSYIIED